MWSLLKCLICSEVHVGSTNWKTYYPFFFYNTLYAWTYSKHTWIAWGLTFKLPDIFMTFLLHCLTSTFCSAPCLTGFHALLLFSSVLTFGGNSRPKAARRGKPRYCSMQAALRPLFYFLCFTSWKGEIGWNFFLRILFVFYCSTLLPLETCIVIPANPGCSFAQQW